MLQCHFGVDLRHIYSNMLDLYKTRKIQIISYRSNQMSQRHETGVTGCTNFDYLFAYYKYNDPVFYLIFLPFPIKS